jgi:hypothetical protein
MSVLRPVALALALVSAATASTAQQVIENDPGITARLAQAYGVSSPHQDSIFFIGDGEALGFLYSQIEGAAGNIDIDVGYFREDADGLHFAGIIRDLYGTHPRDAVFGPDAIRVTTTMPRPGEPRCCPTGAAVWMIDRGTLAVRRE